MAYQYTTQKQIRTAFWEANPSLKKKVIHASEGLRFCTQNEYHAVVRCAFVDFVDYLSRDGAISSELANRATL